WSTTTFTTSSTTQRIPQATGWNRPASPPQPTSKNWQRSPLNPVLPIGAKGAFDDKFASDPCILHDGSQWVMFYFGNSSDGHARDSYATSPDLHNWTKSGEILIDIGAAGSI